MLQQYQEFDKVRVANNELIHLALDYRAGEPLLSGLRSSHCHLLAARVMSIGEKGDMRLSGVRGERVQWRSLKFDVDRWTGMNAFRGYPVLGMDPGWSDMDLSLLAQDGVQATLGSSSNDPVTFGLHVTTYIRLIKEALAIIEAWADSIRKKASQDDRFFRFYFSVSGERYNGYRYIPGYSGLLQIVSPQGFEDSERRRYMESVAVRCTVFAGRASAPRPYRR